MRKTFYILVLFIILLSGCNSTTNGSYAAILIFNNEEFLSEGYAEADKYTIDNKIGTVSNKVKPEVMPTSNLWSNYLEKGTVLYSSKEDKSVILVNRNEQIEVFRKNSSN